MVDKTTHITFIHGIGNKPSAEQLRRIWIESLTMDRDSNEGFDPEAEGISVSFVYWADLFHDEPIPPGTYESIVDEVAVSFPDVANLSFDSWMENMQEYFPLDDDSQYVDPPASDESVQYERIPLPWFIKQRVMKRFLNEVHDYLFNINEIRDKIRNRVIDDLHSQDVDNHIIVSHSQGTVIAYDVLTGVDECKDIHGFMTVGSPLGIDEVQDKLNHTIENGFPKKLKGDWFNVYDPFDVVSRPDPRLSNDFKNNGLELIRDIKEPNWGKWRHSATKYFQGKKLRTALRMLCDRMG
ncbi:hypothetical protein [Marinicella sp. W31]|uniref:hypothetical protein n=1 Tax=Marinicella sp. W31 TaxID=3023713 RepID=UPI003756956D